MIMPMFLGALSNKIEVSIFMIGVAIERYVLTFVNESNGLFLSRVTRMVVNNTDRQKITSLTIKVGRFQLWAIFYVVITWMLMLNKDKKILNQFLKK